MSVEIGFFPDDLVDRGPFNLIVFNDVFEHLPNCVDALKHVEALLKPGGLAVLNVPSSRGVLLRAASLLERVGWDGLYARLWQKGFASPHVSYFAPHNLELLARRHTPLATVERFALPSISRHGLRARIGASHAGVLGIALFAGLWVMSFAAALLPSDIEVLAFRRERSASADRASESLTSAVGGA